MKKIFRENVEDSFALLGASKLLGVPTVRTHDITCMSIHNS